MPFLCKETPMVFCLFVALFLLGSAGFAVGWGNNEKVRLRDVDVITLHQGRMTSGRRSSPVPQLSCVGGSAGCSAFRPKVVQCYNRGHDGYDIQWECKTDMNSRYRFGEIAVNCEGYDYPEDPYVLKGSCGLEYTIDRVDGSQDQYQSSYDSGYRESSYHNNYKQHRGSSWIGTLLTWGVIAGVVYYIYMYATSTGNQHTQYTAGQTSAPPPAGFRAEYMPENHATHTNTGHASQSWFGGNGGNFWSGAATGGLLGYLFGNSRGTRPGSYYDSGYGYNPGYGYGRRHGGWFGSNDSWSSGWSSGWSGGRTHSRPSAPAQPSSRTASGFGGTKRR